MKNLVYLCPYFGKLPHDQMVLWLQSCKFNTTIDWILYTDDQTEYDYPKNVIVHYTSFDDLKKRIQSKFEFPIAIERAYKLCDFKPAYGYIFEDEIKDYEYWGHCDMSDCLFGDLRKFLTDDVLTENDKTLFWGHMTIYRNDHDVNRRFRLKSESTISYKEVYSNPENMCFDEVSNYSINAIYRHNGYALTRVDYMYNDICPLYYWFRIRGMSEGFVYEPFDNEYRVYRWKSGQLFEARVVGEAIVEKELGYIHYQKRKLNKRFSGNCEDYIIAPDGFWENNNLLTPSWIKKHARKKILYKKYFSLRWNNLVYKIKHGLNI